MFKVRVRDLEMHCVNECPHGETETRICVCVYVCLSLFVPVCLLLPSAGFSRKLQLVLTNNMEILSVECETRTVESS